MRPFKFRARVALELRQREHDTALAALAGAQTALGGAVRNADAAAEAVRTADEQLRAAWQLAAGQTPLEWHLAWRVRLTAERRVCDDECRAREADLRLVTDQVNRTRQRVRSLERLHENARAAWTRDAHREDQQTMDQLAAVRFTQRRKDGL